MTDAARTTLRRTCEIAFCSARPASGRTVIHAVDAVTFDLGIGVLFVVAPDADDRTLREAR